VRRGEIVTVELDPASGRRPPARTLLAQLDQALRIHLNL
jgi:hypothetical protein